MSFPIYNRKVHKQLNIHKILFKIQQCKTFFLPTIMVKEK